MHVFVTVSILLTCSLGYAVLCLFKANLRLLKRINQIKDENFKYRIKIVEYEQKYD